MSQTELARAIGSSLPSIMAIESGSSPYSQHSLEMIADALQVHPSWLILAPPDLLRDTIIRTLPETNRQPRFSKRPSRRQRA